ncbi:MAG: hemerythrin family protein [Deltaproteobacteria bacterium]|nr:hemerythrin family protein [Deltaproteobacteria bacterium]
MGYIEWEERYCIGVDRIDAQHRQFLEYLNRLEQHLSGDGDPGAVGITLNRLSDYANFHFAEEEATMGASGYPGLEVHREQHDDFRLQLADLKARYQSQDRTVVQGLVRFTADWLLRHILEVDRGFGGYLSQAGTKG